MTDHSKLHQRALGVPHAYDKGMLRGSSNTACGYVKTAIDELTRWTPGQLPSALRDSGAYHMMNIDESVPESQITDALNKGKIPISGFGPLSTIAGESYPETPIYDGDKDQNVSYLIIPGAGSGNGVDNDIASRGLKDIPKYLPGRQVYMSRWNDVEAQRRIVEDIARRGRSLRLYGQSYGGSAAYDLARWATEKGYKVDTLDTFDPVSATDPSERKPIAGVKWTNYVPSNNDTVLTWAPSMTSATSHISSIPALPLPAASVALLPEVIGAYWALPDDSKARLANYGEDVAANSVAEFGGRWGRNVPVPTRTISGTAHNDVGKSLSYIYGRRAPVNNNQWQDRTSETPSQKGISLFTR